MNICSVINISEQALLVYSLLKKSPEVLRKSPEDICYRFDFSFFPDIITEIIMLRASIPNMKPIDTGIDIFHPDFIDENGDEVTVPVIG